MMTWVAAVSGLIVGSFVNVLIVRMPRRESIVRPGSRCPNCHASIRWYDNLPVLSYLFLRGRCRGCRNPISLRYPVVELLTALLFVAVVQRFGWNFLVPIRDWPFVAILLAVTFIDLDHRIIPDPLSLGGLVLGLATAGWVPGLGWSGALIGGGVGFGVFYGFAWIYERATGRSGIGGGDIKLLAMLGAFLGLQGVFVTILISSVLGSVIGLIWAASQRERSVMKAAVPFGPFLVLGGLCYYFFGDWIWTQIVIPI